MAKIVRENNKKYRYQERKVPRKFAWDVSNAGRLYDDMVPFLRFPGLITCLLWLRCYIATQYVRRLFLSSLTLLCFIESQWISRSTVPWNQPQCKLDKFGSQNKHAWAGLRQEKMSPSFASHRSVNEKYRPLSECQQHLGMRAIFLYSKTNSEKLDIVKY